MKQVVGTKRDQACPHGCEMVQITDQLWLCDHQAYGWASNLRGAEAEARALVAKLGGLQRLRKPPKAPKAKVRKPKEAA
jgi:hypothetical protein